MTGGQVQNGDFSLNDFVSSEFCSMCTHCVFTVFEQKRRRRRKNRTGLLVNITLSQVQVLSFINSWTSVVLPIQFPFLSFLVRGLMSVFSPCVWGT